MENNVFFNKAPSVCPNIKKDAVLAPYSTFKIGGSADMVAFPKNEEELCSLVSLARECSVPTHVFGNGSNVLFDSDGVKGLVIFTKDIKDISVDGETIRCGCGQALSSLAVVAAKNSLSGLEFAYGIPGTLGGAVYMNAGAFGGEMSSVITETRCFDPDTGKIITLSLAEHEFSYRKSIFEKSGLIALSSSLQLTKANRGDIEALMQEHMQKRKASQPLSYPSAGSTFKRPAGNFAGKLIEDAGLKGTTVGGAQISQKHAGFVINIGGATSSDVLSLMETVKAKVFELFGVMLEPEIIYVK